MTRRPFVSRLQAKTGDRSRNNLGTAGESCPVLAGANRTGGSHSTKVFFFFFCCCRRALGAGNGFKPQPARLGRGAPSLPAAVPAAPAIPAAFSTQVNFFFVFASFQRALPPNRLDWFREEALSGTWSTRGNPADEACLLEGEKHSLRREAGC